MSTVPQTRKSGLREGIVSPAQGPADRTAEVDLTSSLHLFHINEVPAECLAP